MVVREIPLDEETYERLAELARNHGGSLGEVVADLVRTRESIEDFVQQCEDANREALLSQVERAEQDFQAGRFVTWDEVKRRNGL